MKADHSVEEPLLILVLTALAVLAQEAYAANDGTDGAEAGECAADGHEGPRDGAVPPESCAGVGLRIYAADAVLGVSVDAAEDELDECGDAATARQAPDAGEAFQTGVDVDADD